MASKKNTQAVAQPSHAETMRAHPEFPGDLEFLAEEMRSSVKRGRAELINSLEWLARNLTQAAENLKDPTRSPDTCLMSSSLVTTITQVSSAVYEQEKALASLQYALQRDTEGGRFVPHTPETKVTPEGCVHVSKPTADGNGACCALCGETIA